MKLNFDGDAPDFIDEEQEENDISMEKEGETLDEEEEEPLTGKGKLIGHESDMQEGNLIEIATLLHCNKQPEDVLKFLLSCTTLTESEWDVNGFLVQVRYVLNVLHTFIMCDLYL